MLPRVRIVTPGGASYGPGTVSWTCPEYNTLTIDLFGTGAGGGGAGSYSSVGQSGSDGLPTTFAAGGVMLTANGGHGGPGGPQVTENYDLDNTFLGYGGGNASDGADGTASGGDTNTTGGGESGGSGGGNPTGNGAGGKGGNGGRCTKTFTYGAPGAPIPGNAYTIVVAAGGSRGVAAGGSDSGSSGNPGTNAVANLSWS
jgi:hypothetical protein